MTTLHNIVVPSGTTFELHARYVVNGLDVSTVNYRGKLQVRPFVNSPIVLFEANTVNGMVAFTGIDAGVHLLFPPEISDAWLWTIGVYDLFIKSPGGIVKRPLRGLFTVDKSITSGTVV